MLEAMVMAVTAAEPPLHLMHVMSHDTFYVCVCLCMFEAAVHIINKILENNQTC